MRKGLIIGLLGVFLVSWCLTPIEAKSKEEIYQEKLAKLEPDDAKGHYELGRWCERNKFPEKAQELFKKTIELDSQHRDARRKLGHFKYKGKWTSPEEMTTQGLVKYKGKWISYEQAMKAKGMVEFEGQWVTKSEKKKLEARAQKMKTLAKQFPYKGVLDKPGADSENLPWEEARTKETEHFIIKANLSEDALNDICFLMECAYLTWQDFLGVFESTQKLNILVMKNRDEFVQITNDLLGVPPTGLAGLFSPQENYSGNKAQEDLLSAHYKLRTSRRTSNILLHEGTHYSLVVVARACGLSWVNPPQWLWEGLSVYFEASKIKGKKLVANLISRYYLPRIKKLIQQNSYIELKDLINRQHSEYDFKICFPEGWSLVYFLVNGQAGKYKPGFQEYLEAWKKKEIAVKRGTVIADKKAHLKLFEECMGVQIDQLEKEWKEYILGLEEDNPK